MRCIVKKINRLIVSAFVAGFALMTVELIATRLMAPYVGSSIYTWTSVIGVVMFGMAIGNYGGGIYADRHGSRRSLATLFIATSMATFLIPLVAYFSPLLVLSGLPISIATFLLAMILFCIPAVFFGTLYPGILQLHLQTIDTTGVRSGQISAAWSLGGIMGTFLTGFYFIGYIGSTTTVLLMAGVLLINAAMLSRITKKSAASIAMLVLIAGAMTYGMYSFTNARGAVFVGESAYYKIRVVDGNSKNKGRIRMLFLDADSHSMESLDGQRLDTYPEISPIFSVMNGNIHDVLLLGGGSYALPKNMAAFYKGSDVTTVEIDPKVQRIAEAYFRLKEYPVHAEISDGRTFLQRKDKKYDLIFADTYNSFITSPWHMVTVEFDRLVKSRLNPDGIYAINVFASLEGDDSRLLQSMVKTLGTVFGKYYIFAYGKDARQPQNIILVGVNGAAGRLSDAELRERIARLNGGAAFSNKMVADYRVKDADAMVLTDDYAPIERLMTPLIRDYFPEYAKMYYSAIMQKG